MSAYEFQGWYRVGNPGSGRVPRVGFGISPKQSFERDSFAGTPEVQPTKRPPLVFPGSAGCQPAAFGRFPNPSAHISPVHASQGWRQAAANYRLAACAPQHSQ
jgi:hypothetical protein